MIESKGLRFDKNGKLQLDRRHKSFYYCDRSDLIDINIKDDLIIYASPTENKISAKEV